MTGNQNTSNDNGLPNLGRRTYLKGAAAALVAGGGLSGSGTAVGQTTNGFGQGEYGAGGYGGNPGLAVSTDGDVNKD
ncbi:hypothetical protein [Haloarcula salinisoli]|uniref:Uncharacterized protein n=1 Tax=Haloarcula salinisoli TaxID=2487746 RepID=A0A8J7YDA4_9EURY|nr:hypothetical protein [Halomicroarcula salinisoli]MBX0285201.1 hypothetical protein [Halomicroarcula salinisoli]MBX0303322.1 hypothetical protein [Halomicroarcula salinisoli]